MAFIDIVKTDLSEKHLSMLESKIPNLNIVNIVKIDKFSNNFSKTVKRINEENTTINEAIKKYRKRKSEEIEERKRRIKEEETRKRREEEQKIYEERRYREKEKEESFLFKINILKYIFYIPLLISLIFVIIYIVNSKQIKIKIGETSSALQVLFLIVFCILSIVLYFKLISNLEDMKKEKTIEIKPIILVIIEALSSVFGIANIANLEVGFYPPKHINIEAYSKTNSSYSYSYSESTIYFNIENNSSVEVDFISCKMNFYNKDVNIGTYSVDFSGRLLPGDKHSFSVDFREYNSDYLYNTSFDDLGIECKIIQMGFSNIYDKINYNSDFAMIKEPSKSQNNYYNLESQLKFLAGDYAILPDDYEIFISYSTNTSLTIEGRTFTTFFCDLKVSESKKNTYEDDFKKKLDKNNFSLLETYYFNNEYCGGEYCDYYLYHKEATIILFSEIQELNDSYFINYYAWEL